MVSAIFTVIAMAQGTSSNPIVVGNASDGEEELNHAVTGVKIRKRKSSGPVSSSPRKEITRRTNDSPLGGQNYLSLQETFKPELDAVTETSELEVPFELDIPVDSKKLRCRLLNNFTIYAAKRQHEPALLCSLHAFDSNASLKEQIQVTGSTSALHEDSNGNPIEDDLEENEADVGMGSLGISATKIDLSTVLRYTARVDHKTGHCDIYLQTSYAMYRLAQPSPQYRQMYFDFWSVWQITTYLDLLLLVHPQATFEDFIAELRAQYDVAAKACRLGYEQNRLARHVVSWPDLADRLRDVLLRLELYIPDLSLHRQQRIGAEARPRSESVLAAHAERCRLLLRKLACDNPRAIISRLWLDAAAAADLLRAQLPKPLLTTIVGNMVAPFFKHIDYDVITSDGRCEAPRSRRLSKTVPRLGHEVVDRVRSLKWTKRLGPHRERIVGGALETVTDYSGVNWGAEEIQLGCTVLLISGTESESVKPTLALVKGLRRKLTMREGVDIQVDNFAHLQYFVLARDIPELGEAASDRELMLTLHCERSVPLQVIRGIKKCTPAYGMVGAAPVASGFFFRYTYEPTDRGAAFSSIPSGSVTPCNACQNRQRCRPRYIPSSSEHKHGVTIDGQSFHVDDLIFIDGKGLQSQIFRKAILADVIFCEDHTVLEITLLDAMDSIKRRGRDIPLVGDECILVKTATQLQIGISCVRGKIPSAPSGIPSLFLASALNSYQLRLETAMETDLATPRDCRPLTIAPSKCMACAFVPTQGPRLTAADIYAGAGGLVEGARQTGSIDSTYAIEWDRAAVCTLRANHTATVHCAPVEQVLKTSILRHHGISSNPVDAKRAGPGFKDVLLLPAPFSIDILSGGPPCQGFSGLNRFATDFDERNFQLAVFLGLVEWLQPRHIVLENVPNMLSASMRTNVGGEIIEKWACKMVCSTLLALGYQIRTQVLCAADFGTPQSRKRAIIIAARADYSLPDALQPLYAFSAPAPRPPVSAWDSISDLPQWDYARPNGQRYRNNLPELNPSDYPVGYRRTPYATQPVNVYQQAMCTSRDRSYRSSCSSHITKPCSAIDVERIYHINNGPEDQIRDWRCLPQELLPAYAPFAGLLGRAHPDVPFSTTSTHHNATGKTIALHPTNHRLLSQREQCRRQGFDDSYKFCGSMDEIQRQIGNSVPPQLARAIFASILRAAEKK